MWGLILFLSLLRSTRAYVCIPLCCAYFVSVVLNDVRFQAATFCILLMLIVLWPPLEGLTRIFGAFRRLSGII